jgi:predicted heme/steroid binding protein
VDHCVNPSSNCFVASNSLVTDCSISFIWSEGHWIS